MRGSDKYDFVGMLAERQRETVRDRERQRETERETERDIETERDREMKKQSSRAL